MNIREVAHFVDCFVYRWLKDVFETMLHKVVNNTALSLVTNTLTNIFMLEEKHAHVCLSKQSSQPS